MLSSSESAGGALLSLLAGVLVGMVETDVM